MAGELVAEHAALPKGVGARALLAGPTLAGVLMKTCEPVHSARPTAPRQDASGQRRRTY